MKIGSTNACEHIRIYNIIMSVVKLLYAHVAATLVAILSDVLYKGSVTKTSKTNS